ncbi:MAG: hypothetical protein KKG04_00860 [Candidatus Thermoplasmatota archaeon]|nr:hypothetical protein [Candidatus Thermoplasmatota archaeon]
MGKERIIPLLALTFLLLSSEATLYVYATTTNATTITINAQTYTYDQIFTLAEPRTIDDFQGIALDDLIKKTGPINPETYTYTINGADGYQKTVKWENLQQGLLTIEGQVIFADLPKAFRVRDVIQIEVK